MQKREHLTEVMSLSPKRFTDDRGFFCETWSKRALEKLGRPLPEFVQDNQSFSYEKNTVRGLHFQGPPHAQGKLVRCGRGRLFDVAVDIRIGSPNFGKWYGRELSSENGEQFWIPAGFLHGFISREPNTEIIYKCTAHYAPECEGAVRFDDPKIGIDWGIDPVDAILSDRDASAPFLRDILSPFHYVGAA